MSYREVRKETAEKLGTDELGPCRQCGINATLKTRSDFGGICAGCFESYCAQPLFIPNRGDRHKDPLDWARALKAREESGERLSSALRMMWRGALMRHESEEQT